MQAEEFTMVFQNDTLIVFLLLCLFLLEQLCSFKKKLSWFLPYISSSGVILRTCGLLGRLSDEKRLRESNNVDSVHREDRNFNTLYL